MALPAIFPSLIISSTTPAARRADNCPTMPCDTCTKTAQLQFKLQCNKVQASTAPLPDWFHCLKLCSSARLARLKERTCLVRAHIFTSLYLSEYWIINIPFSLKAFDERVLWHLVFSIATALSLCLFFLFFLLCLGCSNYKPFPICQSSSCITTPLVNCTWLHI